MMKVFDLAREVGGYGDQDIFQMQFLGMCLFGSVRAFVGARMCMSYGRHARTQAYPHVSVPIRTHTRMHVSRRHSRSHAHTDTLAQARGSGRMWWQRTRARAKS